ncbi:MAG TPA: SDR family NAD(P)-dependent oxidoreductase [Puia sp.]|jgi:NAD(P)-dependent dehydrogenase (short-subunit alcohol dehydrogenase family)|nr:SDR family NAD(P)-dependent oxidoreductase [Puia sp.]
MKNIIITGCSSGFGWLMAKHLAKEGHTVYATMRNIKTTNLQSAKELLDWAKTNGVRIFIKELDVSREDSIKTAIRGIALACGGKIDVLINNAGFATSGLIEEYSDQQVHEIFETLVHGPNRVTKAVLPYMHRYRDGLLILMSSRMSSFQLPFVGIYSAAKAAVQAMAKSYHYELKHSGIESVVVQSGSYKTGIGEKSIIVENSAVAKKYGDWYRKTKEKVVNLFTTYKEPQDMRQITDLISTIINTPTGKRKLIYPVGLGMLETPIHEINAQSENMSTALMEMIGV